MRSGRPIAARRVNESDGHLVFLTPDALITRAPLITALLPLTPDIVSIGLALWSTGRCAVGRRAVHYVAAISFCFNVNNNGNSVRTRHVLKCCQYRLLVTDVNVGASACVEHMI